MSETPKKTGKIIDISSKRKSQRSKAYQRSEDFMRDKSLDVDPNLAEELQQQLSEYRGEAYLSEFENEIIELHELFEGLQADALDQIAKKLRQLAKKAEDAKRKRKIRDELGQGSGLRRHPVTSRDPKRTSAPDNISSVPTNNSEAQEKHQELQLQKALEKGLTKGHTPTSGTPTPSR